MEQWSDNVSVVHLADDPQFTDELGTLEGRLVQSPCHVVLDFATVTFVTSSNISRLLTIRTRLHAAERRMICCGLPKSVWSTFLHTGLDKVFTFAENVPTALATLQIKPPTKPK